MINIKEDTSVFWTDKRKAKIIANNMCVTQEIILRNGRLYYPHTQILYIHLKKKRKEKVYLYNLRSKAVSNDGSLVDVKLSFVIHHDGRFIPHPLIVKSCCSSSSNKQLNVECFDE